MGQYELFFILPALVGRAHTKKKTKTVKYRFTKVGRLTETNAKEVAKIILRLIFLTGRYVLRKIQRALPHREHRRKWPIFDSGCTGWNSMAENFVNIIFTKSARLSGRDPSEGVKITFNLHFLTWTQVLRKNQRGLLNREKLHGCFIFDSGCTGWQSKPKNLFDINLPN